MWVSQHRPRCHHHKTAMDHLHRPANETNTWSWDPLQMPQGRRFGDEIRWVCSTDDERYERYATRLCITPTMKIDPKQTRTWPSWWQIRPP